MLIRVMYKNHEYDMVKSSLLDTLIKSGKVKMFLRSEGWVVVGRDSIREKDERLKGSDRREKQPVYHVI
jgi:hypothetical protein